MRRATKEKRWKTHEKKTTHSGGKQQHERARDGGLLMLRTFQIFEMPCCAVHGKCERSRGKTSGIRSNQFDCRLRSLACDMANNEKLNSPDCARTM